MGAFSHIKTKHRHCRAEIYWIKSLLILFQINDDQFCASAKHTKYSTHTQISNSNSSFAEKMIMAQEKIGANFNGNAAKFAVWCLTISNDKMNGIKKNSVEILVISIVSFHLAVTMCFRTLFQCFNIGFSFAFTENSAFCHSQQILISHSSSPFLPLYLLLSLSFSSFVHVYVDGNLAAFFVKWNFATTFAVVYAVFYFTVLRRFVWLDFSLPKKRNCFVSECIRLSLSSSLYQWEIIFERLSMFVLKGFAI